MVLPEQYSKAKKWVKENQKLLHRLRGQWIAYNGDDGVIAHGKEAAPVARKAEESGLWHVLKYVNPYTYAGLRRLVPIHFRPLHKEVWEPNVIVSIKTADNQVKELEMLVDSGADISTVSLQIGEELGLQRVPFEFVNEAAGVNGTVQYVLRMVEMTLEGHTFSAPVAWLLEPDCDDLLLGREVVFDLFDIEFKQKDETIIFKKRDDSGDAV
jgi:hypothetical protein